MRVRIRCQACGVEAQIEEIDALSVLECRGCGARAETRAGEDFASAVEDALTQLWHIGRSFDLRMTLDTADIPTAFVPPGEDL